MALNLDRNAQQLLATFQQRNQPLSRQVEQQLSQAAVEKGQALSMKELEQLLVQAMPEQKQQIAEACGVCAKRGYHPDGKNENFLTQIIGTHKIVKDRAEAFNPPPVATPTWRYTRDPLSARFVMDNDAKSMFLFNPRDVDQNGSPLLMKVVLRVTDPSNAEQTKAEVDAFKADRGFFEGYRTKWEKDPDIVVVGKDDAYVETHDMQEAEFAFGDPLLQVSFGNNNKEISRGVTVDPDNTQNVKFYRAGPGGAPDLNRPVAGRDRVDQGVALDTTPPMAFDQRIQLKMTAKEDFPPGGWLNTKASFVDASLVLERGLIFEPKAAATVDFLGTRAATKVPADDAFLVGSPSAETNLENAIRAQPNYSIGHVLRQQLTRTVVTEGHNDQQAVSFPAWQMIFANPERTQVAGAQFNPLGDRSLKRSEFENAKVSAELYPVQDPENNGTKVRLKLGEGFLSANDGASVKNWTVVVGFVDHEGKWQQCEATKIKSKECSQDMGFTLDLTNTTKLMEQGKSLEVRMFNDNGVPAQRVLVPFTTMPWSKEVIGG